MSSVEKKRKEKKKQSSHLDSNWSLPSVNSKTATLGNISGKILLFKHRYAAKLHVSIEKSI